MEALAGASITEAFSTEEAFSLVEDSGQTITEDTTEVIMGVILEAITAVAITEDTLDTTDFYEDVLDQIFSPFAKHRHGFIMPQQGKCL